MTDPAAGKWEMPGGTLEEGETPQAAAIREWTEETGLTLPVGSMTGGWESANGIYVGFVYTIACEADVPILDGRDLTSDPDIDGDTTEALAWWTPNDMLDNPVVRDELSADMLAVLDQLQGSGSDEEIPPVGPSPGDTDPIPDPEDPGFIAKASGPWESHPARKIEGRLAAAHAGPVQAALAGSVSRAQLQAVVAAFIASRPDA